MTTPKTTAPALKKYRVTLTEQLVYTIDVLAPDEEQAQEIALEKSQDVEPESEGGNAEVETLDDDDPDFDPINL